MGTPPNKSAANPWWRALRRSDIAEVDRIARRVHPSVPERPEIFAEKLALFPLGCFALERAGDVLGYALAHPWTLDDIPRLDTLLTALPDAPDCLYLHDIALVPEARGFSSAAVLDDLLAKIARPRGIPAVALVALYGADRLWSRLGYRPRLNDALPEKLKSYGETALYMTKEV